LTASCSRARACKRSRRPWPALPYAALPSTCSRVASLARSLVCQAEHQQALLLTERERDKRTQQLDTLVHSFVHSLAHNKSMDYTRFLSRRALRLLPSGDPCAAAAGVAAGHDLARRRLPQREALPLQGPHAAGAGAAVALVGARRDRQARAVAWQGRRGLAVLAVVRPPVVAREALAPAEGTSHARDRTSRTRPLTTTTTTTTIAAAASAAPARTSTSARHKDLGHYGLAGRALQGSCTRVSSPE